ncbi:MAG TPA: HlyD family efflux transporter periplasmic adaptor subunit [Chitinophagaceae bacterium]|nr:HlyD family efflux transporter periplasmic adaptor subunit [Chitinophagaceae bacterium]HPN60095.1 HlyD family efflux transporter periplasmic adaptor subunit [Chitinophagaceae bacterium]
MNNNEHPQWSSFRKVYRYNKRSRVRYWFYGLMTAMAIILFLPWTQNIRAKGTVTTLRQEQRPQQLNTIIPGRVIKWYVKEGDYVQAGDTILQLAEIKDDYLDPQLLSRTKEQLSAKSLTVDYYKNKVGTSGTQINALNEALQLKMDQLRNKLQQLQLKVQSDSMESIAASNDFKIATQQFTRQKAMYDSGLVSLTQLEQRNQTYQNSLAKKVSAENKWQNARQDLTITRIEMNATQQDYMEKIAKAQGDQFQSLSQIATGQGDIAKLENQYSNYSIRNGLYFITAPQSGQITKARKAGIGEIVKDSEMIVEIVPDQVQYAVELFVRPVDLPLISAGQEVRFMFDGFPAIVFSGWPNTSYGTFGGKVVAVESSVSYNGRFRILITEDPADKPWPRELKMGTGAQGMALLKDVPIWYELWRNVNGFPPDFYKAGAEPEKK